MEERIAYINRYIIDHHDSSLKSGLLFGKMGLSLYFYHQARKYNDSEYLSYAEMLLDEVLEDNRSRSLDFEFGLSGIGWGLQTLKNEGYIKWSCSTILADIDNLVFGNIIYSKHFSHDVVKEKIYYGLYLCKRISYGLGTKQKQLNDILLNEFLISIINQQDANLSTIFKCLEKEIEFCLNDTLPAFALLLTQAYKLDIYSHKIARITDQIVYYLEYNTPRLNSNRLLLLVALYRLNLLVESQRMATFLKKLSKAIEVDSIAAEMCLEDCSLQFGLSGLLLACHTAQTLHGDLVDRASLARLNQTLSDAIDTYIAAADMGSPELKVGLMDGIVGTLLTKEITSNT